MLHTIAKHLQIYRHILATTLQQNMEYRWNFFIELFYGPAYVFVMYATLRIAYYQTPTLAGWNQAEGMLLFAVFHFIYTTSFMLFITPIRDLLWRGIRQGTLDFYMTKPLNTQFMATFYPPGTDQIALILGIAVFFILQLVQQSPFSTLAIVAFIASFIAGFVTLYASLVFYASFGFYLTRAQQIFELYNKASDYAQYPVALFPQAIAAFFFTIVPSAFYSYIPAAILLEKVSLWWSPISVLVAISIFVLSRKTWQRGIRAYSSASS